MLGTDFGQVTRGSQCQNTKSVPPQICTFTVSQFLVYYSLFNLFDDSVMAEEEMFVQLRWIFVFVIYTCIRNTRVSNLMN